MGRSSGTSRRASRRHRDGRYRERRKSVRSSSSDDSTDRGRIKRLEALIKQPNNRTQEKSLCSTIHRQTTAGDENMIPLFDPIKNEITIEQWIKRVDELALHYQWDDRSIFYLIISRLEGHAKQWFQWEQHKLVTWAETKKALLQNFRKQIPFAKLLSEAVNYETSPDQNLGDYFLHKLNKIRKYNIEITDECIIDLIIYGVKNKRIVGDIRAAGKTTTNELYNYMLTLGETPQLGETLRQRRQGYNVRPRGIAKNYKRNEKPGKLEKRNIILCYNCDKAGHMSRKCTKARIQCNNCNRVGHRNDMCKTREMRYV